MRKVEQSRRFVSLDKPIDKFIEDQKDKNTLDTSLLTEFLNSKNIKYRSFVFILENQLKLDI